MKSKIVLQECNECHRQFNIIYYSNGSYDYLDDTCDCESDFSPVNDLSIYEWIDDNNYDINISK